VRFSSGGAPGVLPFAGLVPHSGGHAAQVRRLTRLATFLPDRAHVPFVPAHPSRLIFVGMIGRRLGTSESKGGRPGMSWLRLLGFAPVCGPTRDHATTRRSCLGLCLLQGCRARIRASRRARPRRDHQPPETPRPLVFRAAARSPIRSWVWRRPSRTEMRSVHASCASDHVPVITRPDAAGTRATSPLPSAY